MKMSKMNNVLSDESGAVTVDWVVLTATMIVMGIATTLAINTQIEGMAVEISDHMENTSLS